MHLRDIFFLSHSLLNVFCLKACISPLSLGKNIHPICMPSPVKEHTHFFLCSPDGSLPIFSSAHVIGIKRKTYFWSNGVWIGWVGDQVRQSLGASFRRRSISGVVRHHFVFQDSTDVRTYRWENSSWYLMLSLKCRQSYVPPGSNS